MPYMLFNIDGHQVPQQTVIEVGDTFKRILEELKTFKISREGYVLLQFAPASASWQYNWTRKQVFSLSVGEMGTVISLGKRESCEFFHDRMKSKSQGKQINVVVVVVNPVALSRRCRRRRRCPCVTSTTAATSRVDASGAHLGLVHLHHLGLHTLHPLQQLSKLKPELIRRCHAGKDILIPLPRIIKLLSLPVKAAGAPAPGALNPYLPLVGRLD
ncbi:hypothetical protein Ahy_A03g014621 isoform B [Arachis hypogaea]|uniref:Uncharacterized protein n=1 Tax=Arachis hypogaea TaxID=3818 RepID=A0A445DY95_ARAHY|nr:hypothetical protein Ahy_A03g014621 isoform B [Arachis hypogaea]